MHKSNLCSDFQSHYNLGEDRFNSGEIVFGKQPIVMSSDLSQYQDYGDFFFSLKKEVTQVASYRVSLVCDLGFHEAEEADCWLLNSVAKGVAHHRTDLIATIEWNLRGQQSDAVRVLSNRHQLVRENREQIILMTMGEQSALPDQMTAICENYERWIDLEQI